MKTILIPTDFSKNAWNTISYAMEFFKNKRCTFFFLHTYTPAFYRMDYMLGGPEFSAIPDVGVDNSLEGLEKTLENVVQKFHNPKHIYKIVSAFNILTDEINELTEKKEIDLIIMGTQGATGAKEIFLGSNTVHVIRKATVPILAVPANYKFTRIEKILFPTDYLAKFKNDGLDIVIEISKMYLAPITVLHVKEEYELTEDQEDNIKNLKLALAQVTYKIEEVRGTHMPNAIYEYIEENNIDLLAMMNRKHTFLERMMVKQNLDQIGFHVKIPFLVIPDRSRKTK